MPLPPEAGGAVQNRPQNQAGILQPATPATPPAAIPNILPTNVPAQPPAGQSGATPQAAGQPGAPQIADDGDLIEKTWVLKAKQIVGRTQSDPHAQTKELHSLKEDYMKKRYNKTIGAVDE